MLVAFSHLRWGFVWQRPQHLLTRFARDMPVIVVEEPEFGSESYELRVWRDHGVTIVTPLVPAMAGKSGFGPHINREISRLLEPLLPPSVDPIYWYYTPMALGAEPMGSRPSLTVYDAMDDLASFLAAPRELRSQEARLLTRVDLVFTGGPSIYRQRRDAHPSVHCFPSGVETEHFTRRTSVTTLPQGLAAKPRPILGYYGVIDERLDLALLADIADLRPEWTMALIGPVAKIDDASIPVRPNIIRFGQQAYADLPAFLGCFDVAMMPFARNEATRAISPTKTLEYLAGQKPVVSTPIADVMELYGEVVQIASTARDFVAATESIMTRTSDEEQQWRDRAARLVAVHDWDAIARDMWRLMMRSRAAMRRELIVEPVASLSA